MRLKARRLDFFGRMSSAGAMKNPCPRTGTTPFFETPLSLETGV
jgi:hypothetical protein